MFGVFWFQEFLMKSAMAALHYETSLRHNQQQTYPEVFQSCF